MKCSRKQLGLAILLAQSVAVPAAYAQLEEIIVTAERREASLQDTDISITAFSESTLTELGVSNYLDLADFAPNVMMHEMPGKAGGAIAIRGFKNAETISSFEPKVGLYLDGVIIAKGAGSVFDVLDLERVEILRGPQGTLYGRNTAGGAVNFITKKPSDEFAGKISATLGDYGQRDLKGTINIPLIGAEGILATDSDALLAVKATWASLNRDGYYRNILSGQELADKDRQVGHAQVLWEPSQSLSFLYSFDQTKIDEAPYPLRLIATSEARASTLGPYIDLGNSEDMQINGTPFMEADVEGHSFTVNWEINENLSLVGISALRTFEVDNQSDSDGTPVWVLQNASGDDAETFTQEVRLVGSAMDDRLEFVVGGFYMDEDIKEIYSDSSIGIGFPFGGPHFSSRSDATAQNEVWAIFGETTFKVTDKFDVTLGARYTEEDKTMTRFDTSGVIEFGLGNVVNLPEANQEFDNISGLVSFSYHWTDDVMTYLKFSEGYVSGGFNPRAPNSQVDLWLAGYDEETLLNMEFGWKATLLDNRLQINGAIFNIDYKELQVNQLTPTGDNNIGNAGDATIEGMEIEIIALPTDNLEIGGGYGYLDPQYDTYIDAGGNDLSNNHWAHAPENTFNAYARYTVPDVVAGGKLTFRVDYSWVDDHFLLTANPADAVDKNVAPSYDFVNARVSLTDMQLGNGNTASVSLWGRNLTDELWYTSGYDLTNGSLGFADKAPSPPRTYGLDLTMEF